MGSSKKNDEEDKNTPNDAESTSRVVEDALFIVLKNAGSQIRKYLAKK
jgi:hypothetical protein